ncbi:PREDICTED: uncharacterized protein LOC104799332 [Tarenaya hassleriana]|uniref:uncharacterized protein LOC104799332 n=1 Tax=Tarenaya hassleriana TaxID=28532 RepID=UPI00053C61EC|nr:PREDICTED: uncharacterized protein LOC104799332 [Tarenaya hassleriana]
MASASHALLSPNGCVLASPKPLDRFFFRSKFAGRKHFLSVVRASSDDPDCNEEECAPDKEVGKVSVEWLAGDKTKVVGTFPPRKRGWTGYVEKDTAGQTNIYSVEPAVYVAESVISSGNAGSSSEGAENTAAIVAGLALISVAAASSILLQVGKTPTQPQATQYNGPSLSYYINKFKPPEIIETSVPAETEAPPPVAEQETPAVEAQPEVSSAPSTTSTAVSEGV